MNIFSRKWDHNSFSTIIGVPLNGSFKPTLQKLMLYFSCCKNRPYPLLREISCFQLFIGIAFAITGSKYFQLSEVDHGSSRTRFSGFQACELNVVSRLNSDQTVLNFKSTYRCLLLAKRCLCCIKLKKVIPCQTVLNFELTQRDFFSQTVLKFEMKQRCKIGVLGI